MCCADTFTFKEWLVTNFYQFCVVKVLKHGCAFVSTAVGILLPSCGSPGGWGQKVKKGKLKLFIRWLFFHYPRVSPGDVTSLPFWNVVGAMLTQKTKEGDTQAPKFIPLYILI